MLLINPSEVIKYAFNSREMINSDLIRDTKIDISQEVFVRPRIGDVLFDKITAGEHKNLTDEFIKPALAYFIRYIMIEELAVKLSDDGAILYAGGQIEETQTNTTNQTVNASKETIDNGQEIKKADSETSAQDKTQSENATRKEVGTNNVAKTETHNIDKDSITVNTTINENSTDESFATANTDIDSTKTDKTEIVINDVRKVDSEKSQTQTNNENATNTLEKLINQTQNDTTNRLQNNTNQRSTKNFTPASSIMIGMLKSRSLSDANALIKKAVRHIKNNPQIYGPLNVTPDPFLF